MNQWKFQVYAIPLLGWKSFTRLICVRKAPHCRPMIDSLSVLFIFRCIHTWQVELFCWESNYILETALGRKVASAFYPRIIYEKKFLNIKTVSMYDMNTRSTSEQPLWSWRTGSDRSLMKYSTVISLFWSSRFVTWFA